MIIAYGVAFIVNTLIAVYEMERERYLWASFLAVCAGISIWNILTLL